jgi:PAS domain S-box-containing protein
VRALGYALGIRAFLAVPNPATREAIIEDATEVRRAIAEYGGQAISEGQRAMVTRLSSLWGEFEHAGQALMARADATGNVAPKMAAGNDSPGAPPTGDEHVRTFDGLLLQLETFLDDELQRAGDDDYRARLQGTVRHGSDIEDFALITLLVGTAVALLVSVTVGRAVGKSEGQGLAARQFADDIVEAVRQPLLVLDGQLRTVRANRAFYHGFDTVPEQTEGRPLHELGNGQWDVPRLQTLLTGVLAGQADVQGFELVHDFPRIGQRIMRLDARRMQSATRTPLVLLTIDDVTDRERAERDIRESRELLRSVLDSMPQKISTSTSSGDWDYLNPQWTEYTGLSFERIREWGWTQVIHPDDVAENLRVWQASIRTGEPFQFEHRVRGRDGEYRWHISRALPVRDAAGTIVMWVGSNTDIDQQKSTANALRQLTAQLSQADRRKDEFLAMLAHELRNPLAPIRNAVEILRRSGTDEATIDRMTDVMRRQLAHMVRLIDDLLDVSRVSLGKIELRQGPVDLASIVKHAVELSRILMEKGGVHLTVSLPDEPTYIHADATRMTQVIGNLLNNAVKFTPTGGEVSLILARVDGYAVIRVRDTGIGIAPDHLRHVFDMFMQADTTLERTKSGLGIGLTLAKTLVELHGGTIEAYSPGVNRGTEMVVRIPAGETPPATPASEASDSQTSSRARRVLVVDDNHDSAESLEILLQLSGHHVRIAHDGLEAVTAAASFLPDVVVLDIGLPKLNGYEAARRIRALPSGTHLKLVALTGWGQDSDRQRSAASGFDFHLVKPVDHEVLLKLIADVRAR